MNRQQAIKVAEETLDIFNKGYYTNNKQEVIWIKKELEQAVEESILYTPEKTERLLLQPFYDQNKVDKTIIEVTTETTLQASKRLVEAGFEKVLRLNLGIFASAKKPGEGFLKESMAQEESLARASGLYSCISQKKEMYEYNKKIERVYTLIT